MMASTDSELVFAPDIDVDEDTYICQLVKLDKLKELKSVGVIKILTYNEDRTGRNLLHIAAASNSVDIINFLCTKLMTKVSINAQDNEGNTSLHLAVLNGHVGATNAILNHNADDTILNQNEDPPLHLAIKWGKTLVSEFSRHPNVNLLVHGRHGRTTLQIVVLSDENIEFLQILYEEIILRMQDADFSTRDRSGLTTVHLAARVGSHQCLDFILTKSAEHNTFSKDLLNALSRDHRSPLHYAVERGHIESVQVILKHGGDPVSHKGSQPSALHLACSQGKMNIIKLMVNYCGNSILQSPDQEGGSTLHSSTSSINSKDLILYLVENGVNVNGVDINGLSPLANAVLLGNTEAVEHLLNSGADPCISDKWGRTSMHLAVIGKRIEVFKKITGCGLARVLAEMVDNEGNYPIHLALRLGKSDMVSSLLSLNSNYFRDREGNNYIHLAAISGDNDSLKELLSRPDNHHMVNEANNLGFTPLHYAAIESNPTTIKKIIDYGAVIHKTNDGHTPFMCACSKGNFEAAKLLYYRNSFQKNWVDTCGDTALHLAVDGQNPEVIEFCLDEGISITLNHKELSFFDKILEKADRKLAEVAMQHKRWEECIRVASPNRPHPIIRILDRIPEAYGMILDQCFSRCSLDPKHPDYWEEFNFRCLMLKPEYPDDKESMSSKVKEIEMEDFEEFHVVNSQLHTESNIATESFQRSRKGLALAKWQSRKENCSMAVVHKLIKNRQESYLLHPVVLAYIRMKWEGFPQQFRLVTMLIYFIFALLLSVFLIVIPLPPQNTNSKFTFAENQSGSGTAMESDYGSISTGAKTLLYFLLLVTILNLWIFILYVYISGLDLIYRFTASIQLWPHLLALICTLIFLLSILVNELEGALWNSGALAIFFAWLAFGFSLQFLNILNIGVYITMLISTTKLVFKVLAILFVFLLAFAFPFYVLVGSESSLQYTNIGVSLFTTLHSLIAVTDFFRFFSLEQSDELRFSHLIFFFLILLIVLLPIVFINLLIGLAVGDIALIQKEAIINQLSIEVSALSNLDKKFFISCWTKHLPSYHKHYPNRERSWITRFFHSNYVGSAHLYDSDDNVQLVMKQAFAEMKELQEQRLNILQESVEQLAADLKGIKHLEQMIAKIIETQGIKDSDRNIH